MTALPFFKRQAKHAIGKPGRLSELKVAKEAKGRLRPASGAMAGAKGDVSFDLALMECKSTTSDSMSLKLDWLAKISSEAHAEGKTPVLTVSFVDQQGKAVRNGDWGLVPGYLLREWLAS